MDPTDSEGDEVRRYYPSRVLIVLRKSAASLLPDLEYPKLACPANMTIGEFKHLISHHLQSSSTASPIPGRSINLEVRDSKFQPKNSQTVLEIGRTHAQPDGFLYLTYYSRDWVI